MPSLITMPLWFITYKFTSSSSRKIVDADTYFEALKKYILTDDHGVIMHYLAHHCDKDTKGRKELLQKLAMYADVGDWLRENVDTIIDVVGNEPLISEIIIDVVGNEPLNTFENALSVYKTAIGK